MYFGQQCSGFVLSRWLLKFKSQSIEFKWIRNSLSFVTFQVLSGHLRLVVTALTLQIQGISSVVESSVCNVCCVFLVLKVWFLYQEHWFHMGTCEKCTILGSNLLEENLHFSKFLGVPYALQTQKPYSKVFTGSSKRTTLISPYLSRPTLTKMVSTNYIWLFTLTLIKLNRKFFLSSTSHISSI